MQHFNRALLILSTLIASWLGMQAVHELGHVIGAWLTGGEVERVVLHPLTISRTDLANNPRPLLVVWAGPVLGCLLPLLLWGIASLTKMPGAFVLRFFAGFCLIANGLYIGIGSFARIGDCGDMLRHGASAWQLWLFGLLTTPVGLGLWNGQGKNFGLGTAAEGVRPRVAVAVALIALGLIAVGVTIGGN